LSGDRCRPGEDFADLGMDRRSRQDYVARFLQHRRARIDDQQVRHRGIVQLAPARPWRADGIDMRPGLEPRTLQDRFNRTRRGD